MKNRIQIGICIADIIIAFLVHLYVLRVLVPKVALTYYYTPLHRIDMVFLWPSFWLCLGALIAILLFKTVRNRAACIAAGWLSIILVAAYLVLGFLYLAGKLGANGMIMATVEWILKNCFVFVISGLLIGALSLKTE